MPSARHKQAATCFLMEFGNGDKLIFDDMAHYSMVKTTMFNGVPHPAIAIHNSNTGESRIIRTFGYEDYKSRLS